MEKIKELQEKKYPFFNRELSWIEFNQRVLEEALNKSIPLMERLQFLSIVSTNFDEFFQIRVASVKRQLKKNPTKPDISGYTPKALLEKISQRCHEILKIQQTCLTKEILPELAQNGIEYVAPQNFSSDQESFTNQFFETKIFPLLTPIRIDNLSFPHLQNLQLHAAFLLKKINGIAQLPNMPQIDDSQPLMAVVQIPNGTDRIIWLNSPSGTRKFCLLEDLIVQYGRHLFPGFNIQKTMLFQITRDADFSVDYKDQDFIGAMEKIIDKRKSSFAVRILCNQSSPEILKILTNRLKLSDSEVYKIDGILDPSSLLEISNVEKAEHLYYPEWQHFLPPELPENSPYWDIFKQRDFLLNVPYQSYHPVIKFISDAADDPKVLAIKISLYRTGLDSPIVEALKRAAHNGKQVTCFVELMARFDEERNISWAEQLEKAGATVIYGVVNYKVHAKILMVMRRENSNIRRYVFLSTGNFNSKTAKLYSDLGLFTTNMEIANDATQFFNIVSGYSALQTMNHISMAPINLKTKLLAMIQREIESSTPENPGLIIAKMNSLTHQEIIQSLYEASQANVRIYLNIRGICMLVPGIKGISENITVVSIVDRYLEHSRIFYFRNSGSEELYLASADWMPRNLDRRIELMFPITDRNIFKDLCNTMNLYFKDNTHSHTLLPSGKWVPTKTDEQNHRSQEDIYKKFLQQAELTAKTPKTEFSVRRKN